MDHSTAADQTTNGTEPNSSGPVPVNVTCPLEALDPSIHQYIHALENRIVVLEKEQKRFTDALKNAGNFIFNSPQGKMLTIAFPKEMQAKLKEFFNNGNDDSQTRQTA